VITGILSAALVLFGYIVGFRHGVKHTARRYQQTLRGYVDSNVIDFTRPKR